MRKKKSEWIVPAAAFFILLAVLGMVYLNRQGANIEVWETAENDIRMEIPEDYYKPKEFGNMDMTDEASQWCWQRSAESEHFYLFWEAGFGDDPNSRLLPEEMRVDIPDLLEKAEHYYKTNIEELGFGVDDGRETYLDQYKMEIYLLYQEEWLATGSGYDNVIGALWINPSTCQPAGATLAHEIGHCFQYQVYCDQILNGQSDRFQSGFRYAYEDGWGNTFWEQCAQWQAYKDYPEEAFTWYHMDTWVANCSRSFENEWSRYQSYWFMYAMEELYGMDFVGQLWKNSEAPEDALQTFMRLYCGDDIEKLGDALYYYASHAATFDFDDVRDYADEWVGAYETQLYQTEDGYYRIAYKDCPDEAGFNVIELDVKNLDDVATINFRGLEIGSPLSGEDPGIYHIGDDGTQPGGSVANYNELPEIMSGTGEIAGHRYGFVALCADGRRVYSEMYSAEEGVASFALPKDTERLFFVVAGTPHRHFAHKWDEDESNDLQLPYSFQVVE